MNHSVDTTLVVSIQELPAVRVACIDYQASSAQSDFHNEIRTCFQRVQSWVRGLGHDPYSLLNLGVPNVQDGQLVSYGCCVQIPENVPSGPDGIDIRDLPGGRYAVVKMAKDPQTISNSIGCFYREYVPEHNLSVESTRPTYEIYWEDTMDYCVPIR